MPNEHSIKTLICVLADETSMWQWTPSLIASFRSSDWQTPASPLRGSADCRRAPNMVPSACKHLCHRRVHFQQRLVPAWPEWPRRRRRGQGLITIDLATANTTVPRPRRRRSTSSLLVAVHWRTAWGRTSHCTMPWCTCTSTRNGHLQTHHFSHEILACAVQGFELWTSCLARSLLTISPTLQL